MLTIRQHATLDFIRAYHAQHGYAPSLAEIALGLGLSSKGSIHRQVQALAEAGYLRLVPGRKRGIRLLEAEEAAPATLPLLGRIAAGLPIEAIQGEDSLNLTEFLMGPGRFALRVQGDSMIEAGILDGDTVIIRKSDTANNGDIVVALIDGEEATLKRLRHRPGGLVELLPANARLTPLLYPAARVQIQGVLVGQLRTYP